MHPPKKFMKNVVIIGGGVGAATMTKSLKDLPIKLTTIVSGFDDGGSTGLIRRDYGGWAVGDFRNCLLAASDLDDEAKQSLSHRFGPGHLHAAQAGNVLVKAFFSSQRNFLKANRLLHKFLQVSHQTLPVSVSDSRVQAKLSGGGVLTGQRAIAEHLSFASAPIKSISLTKPAKILPQAQKAILEADVIIFAPGHFFTSLLPHLSVAGFARAFKRSKAKKLWFLNLLAHRGQDSYYTLADYLKWFQRSLGQRPFDIIISGGKPSAKAAAAVEDRFLPLKITTKDLAVLKKLKIRFKNSSMASSSLRAQAVYDFVRRAPLRHSPEKVRKVFLEIS